MSSLMPWLDGHSPLDPFAGDIWDPFNAGEGWLWDTGRWGGDRWGDDTTAIARTYVDWRETDNAHIFTAELPVVRKEDMRVQVVDGNVLRISGERTKEEETTTDTWQGVERRRGSFMRRFRLPDSADANNIQYSLDHGVPTVPVPKKATAVAPPAVK